MGREDDRKERLRKQRQQHGGWGVAALDIVSRSAFIGEYDLRIAEGTAAEMKIADNGGRCASCWVRFCRQRKQEESAQGCSSPC